MVYFKMKKFITLTAALFAAFVVSAEVPQDAVVVEAENFEVKGDWRIKPHFPSWYGDRPSGGKFLAGHTKRDGVASKSVDIAAPGKYKLHWRYLDVLNYPGGYKVEVKQNGAILAENVYNEKSQRATPEAQKKYGASFAKFMWEELEFTAPAKGKIEIVLTKLPAKNLTAQGSRHLDLFLLTQDVNYRPQILDLHPLYVQIRMLEDQAAPTVIHVFGRLSRSPSYPPHMNINKKGLHIGAYNGFARKKDWLKAGDASPWVKISDHLTFNGNDRLSFDARSGYRQHDKQASFEILFSTTPDEKNIVKRYVRRGRGNGIIVAINLPSGTITSDQEESRKNLARAEATTDVPGGKAPVKYPFISGVRVGPQTMVDEVIKNEAQVVKSLGLNGVIGAMSSSEEAEQHFPKYTLSAFFFHLNKKCFAQPKTREIEALMIEQGKTIARHKRKPLFINLMDEPDYDVNHVVKCAFCKSNFAAFLAENKVKVSGMPTLDKKQGELFYWTLRYRNRVVTNFFKAATDAAAKHLPGVFTTANFAPDVTGGNSVGRGCDWFEILNSGALTYGWHEDWANLSGTYQCVGFQNAVMRAACRKNNVTYGIYNILCRHPWEVEAKGFAAIGYGNSAMHFFNYGPHYANASDMNSQRPEIYQAIKNVTFAAGAVEDTLVVARPVRGDVAMLLSSTSDIWNRGGDGIFGKERVYLHMLLRHCNYSADVLSEEDLSTELKNYKVLFVVDSHIIKSQLKYILDWVKQGNTLYLGANALMYDEANKALKLPFARKAYTSLHKVSRGQDHFVRPSKKHKKFQKMTIIGGQQLPMNSSVKLGRGRVICSGFFPGLSYMHEAVPAGKNIYSIRNYPEAHRNYIASLKLPAPRVVSSDYRIEAHLLESADKYLIVLSNWTGEKRSVTVEFNGKKYTRTIGAGGFIEISK